MIITFKNKLVFYLAIGLSVLCVACQKTVSSKEELLKWVSLPENGFTGSKLVGEVKYTCKILPSAYLSWRDVEHDHTFDYDEIEKVKQSYDSSLVILFNISPNDPNADWDVMTANVNDQPEYKDKVIKMSFEMKENFSLTIDGKEQLPVLVRLENHYGMKKGRNLMLVFDLDGSKQEDLYKKDFELIYKDELFHSGKMKFNFHDLKALPTINYIAEK